MDDLQLTNAQAEDASEEFEEISTDEVDRVVEALEVIHETVGSENIQSILEDAIDSVYYLVYEDEDEEEVQAEAA